MKLKACTAPSKKKEKQWTFHFLTGEIFQFWKWYPMWSFMHRECDVMDIQIINVKHLGTSGCHASPSSDLQLERKQQNKTRQTIFTKDEKWSKGFAGYKYYKLISNCPGVLSEKKCTCNVCIKVAAVCLSSSSTYRQGQQYPISDGFLSEVHKNNFLTYHRYQNTSCLSWEGTHVCCLKVDNLSLSLIKSVSLSVSPKAARKVSWSRWHFPPCT